MSKLLLLVIGSNQPSTGEFFKLIGTPATHLINEYTSELPVYGHTSCQDITDLMSLQEVIAHYSRVVWANCKSDEFDSLEDYVSFITWLRDLHRLGIEIENLDRITLNPYGFDSPIQIGVDDFVFLGCSFTAGVGVARGQRYSTIISKQFGLKEVNLAVPGGSNQLIFEKFFNINWTRNQHVIVQLTMPGRFRYQTSIGPQNLILGANTCPRYITETMNDRFCFYQTLLMARAMIQYARASQLKLVCWLIDYKGYGFTKTDLEYFFDLKEVVPASVLQNYKIDFGDDGLHPGPKSHEFLAESLYNYHNLLYNKS